uniref:Cytochrome oxidase assembly protein 3, mitochondrial n=1 Tax=Anthurium amnicola TaxID=1678845 RepID=A0A1D1XYT1_9ARAE
MAAALPNSVSTPALALPDSLGLPLFSHTSGRNTRSAGSPLLPICLGRVNYQRFCSANNSNFSEKATTSLRLQKRFFWIPSCTGSTSSDASPEEPSSSSEQSKTPFGYTRKDVLLIGLGVTVIGVGLKSGLEFLGVDPLLAGNVVQLVIVLGLTVGWIFTYIFRVANKDMTYAQQLKDYENKVMQKRVESLTEAELEALLEQVEEEKRQLASGE